MARKYDTGGGTFDDMDSVTQQQRLGVPSRPLLGLPLARWIPSRLHSALDYLGDAALIASGLIARTAPARVAGLTLGIAGATVSALTDTHLSLSRRIPIEVHEAAEYVVAAAAILAPFALRYRRRDPWAAALQTVTGILTLAGALVSDYRAKDGVLWQSQSWLTPERIRRVH